MEVFFYLRCCSDTACWAATASATDCHCSASATATATATGSGHAAVATIDLESTRVGSYTVPTIDDLPNWICQDDSARHCHPHWATVPGYPYPAMTGKDIG